MDKALEDYIKNALAKGFNPTYIEKHLIKHGYQEHAARESVAQLTKKKERKPRHSHHLLRTAITILMILLAVCLVIAIIWLNSDTIKDILKKEPVCQCTGNQTCVEGECVDPECDACHYMLDHVCVKGTCCRDLDCDDGDISTWDRCTLDKNCFNEKISLCVHDDGYCPESCIFDRDNDCDQCTNSMTVKECGIGMHCFNNECVRNQELTSFSDCDPIELQRCETIDGESFCPEQGTCNQTCDSCLESLCVWGANKCVECLSDGDCTNSTCEYYVCT